MSKTIDALLELMAKAPDGQIDTRLSPKFTALVGKSEDGVAAGLKEIRDLMVHDGLASDFGMFTINEVIRLAEQKVPPV